MFGRETTVGRVSKRLCLELTNWFISSWILYLCKVSNSIPLDDLPLEILELIFLRGQKDSLLDSWDPVNKRTTSRFLCQISRLWTVALG